jgi:flagellar hook-basal body complex protein FliE
MSVEAIAAVGAQLASIAPAVAPAMSLAPPVDPSALASMTNLLGTQPTTSVGDGLFDKLVSSLGEIDAGVERNTQAATELALGQADNLHQVLIGAEQTRLQFELAMSMRNRVLEAYQEIMRMQV